VLITGVDSKGTSNTDDDQGISIGLNPGATTPAIYYLPIVDSVQSGESMHFVYSLGIGNGQQEGYTTLHTGASNQNATVNITEVDWTNSLISGSFSGQGCNVSMSTCFSITNGSFTESTFYH